MSQGPEKLGKQFRKSCPMKDWPSSGVTKGGRDHWEKRQGCVPEGSFLGGERSGPGGKAFLAAGKEKGDP